MKLSVSLLVPSGLLFLDVASAYSSYMTKIPNGYNVVGPDGSMWSAVGHSSPSEGSSLNAFGLDFKANGFQWTQELCQMDSDYDGRTNGQELGDPDCVWQEGMEPASSVGITHPGIFNDDFADEVEEEEDAVVNDVEASLNATNTTTGPAVQVPGNTTTGSDQAASASAPVVLTLPPWLSAHIACMMLSWGFLLPIGALMAISFRHTFASKGLWFQLHMYIQILGVILNIVGFVIPFVNIETHFKGTHQIMGTVIFAMGVAQAAQGFIRPGKTDEPTMLRRVWEICHKGFGRIVIILAWVNSFLGIKLIQKFYDGAPGNERVMNVCTALLGLQIALCVVLTLTSFYKSKPPQTEDREAKESESEDSINKTTHTGSGEDHTSGDYKV